MLAWIPLHNSNVSIAGAILGGELLHHDDIIRHPSQVSIAGAILGGELRNAGID